MPSTSFRCKSKFICTIGPASQSESKLRELALNGMGVARLNFSHCSHEFAAEVIGRVRKISAELGRPIGILLDSNGPKLRTEGGPEGKNIFLNKGETFVFYEKKPTSHVVADHQVRAPGVCGNVMSGDKIYVDDGLLSFTVVSANLESVECKVDNSGLLGANKGINLSRTVPYSKPFLTRRDLEDLKFAREQNAEFVTISCIRNGADVEEIKRVLKGSKTQLLSKIENKSGLDNFEQILHLSDGIIIDRGYLGVEIDLSNMATVQKLLIQGCTLTGKPILIANHILESMKELPRPSRSEASDISSTVFLGVDGYILSAETAMGAYPVESLQWLRKICTEAETHIDHLDFQLGILKYVRKPVGISESIASSAVKCAREIDASCIIVSTEGGGMARLIAKYRPSIPIVAGTRQDITGAQLNVSFGIQPYVSRNPEADPTSVVLEAIQYALSMGIIEQGNKVVVASGQVDGFLDGSSTFMRVITIGEDCSILTN